LAIDGHLIHYVDEGVGPMMVFVHAGPAWSFVYRHLIVRMRERVPLRRAGFSGHRAVAGGGRRLALPGRLHCVFGAFIRALGPRRVMLVTHDVGTPVALGAAVRMPERVGFTNSAGYVSSEAGPASIRRLRLSL
jgi:haloalkane dehalogenase